ncbi:hypothetical protein [Nannocystis radixulma]|uniref:Uncharacterized protein n=1 Tax=Nannocystis radixulma TaxID=2995305 RepID=A0ABT5B0C1_9BACT|nr:hypothetical protein [Nannocystis radixulma]MDC0667543.1 hypothetical protein [Nannocystis radixulma]
MSKYTLVLPLLCLVACGDTKVDTASAGTDGDATAGKTTPGMFDSSSTSTTGTSSSGGSDTADDPSMATSGDEPPGTSTATSGVLTTTGDPDDPGDQACDPWLDDCPEGEKCTAYGTEDFGWNNYKCVPIAPQPGQAGDPCTIEDKANSGIDSCDIHLTCWPPDEQLMGHCVPNCHGTPEDPTCEDPDAFCAISDDSVLLLCLPTCDPLENDCAEGDVCVPHHQDLFACVPDLSGDDGQLFDPCEYANVCDPGLACVPTEVAASECAAGSYGCCVPFCDTTQPNTCPGVGQECVQALADPPPKYENAGICVLPS